MNPHELLLTALRSLGLYILMLIVIRLLGKRTIGNFTAFDLLVALMLGEVVDEIIYGDVHPVQGVVSILVIAAAKYATAWLSYSNHKLNKILEGTPSVLIRNGEIQRKMLAKEMMNEPELMASLRLHGIDDMREVKLAVLEVDGLVSVVKESWAEAVQRIDLQKGNVNEEEPPEEKRTYSPKALAHEV